MMSSADLKAREEWIIGLARREGEVTYDPVDPSESSPEISIRVKAPGGPQPHLASFKYSETYAHDERGLVLAGYAYGYWSLQGRGSLEFHWHPLSWSDGASVYHIHCQPSGGRRDHFRSHEMLLEEARDRFRTLYASDRSNDCSGLYPF
jgi:hypothetical protein